MKMSELSEWGRIVKDINTTVDVGPNEIKTQAAKFGNIVDKDGFPPTLSKTVNSKSTNILYNLGLAEGVYYNKDILLEAVIYEGFLDSAKQFLGNKINQTAADISGAIVDLKSAGILIKDIIQDPDYLTKVNAQLRKSSLNLIKQINQLVSQNQIVANLWNKVREVVSNFLSTTGWKGFLSRLGIYGFLRFIVVNTTSITDTVIKDIIDRITDLSNIIPNATMGGFLGVFNTLTTVKEYFLDELTSIKNKLDFGRNIQIQTNSKYTGYELAIIEGGHTLDEPVVEPKKPGRLFTALTEGIMLKLERDKRANMLVLHIKDTETDRRSEVRGKLGYETNGYDANDPLHQLLDKIGKTANISELMNGELVSISPKHPQGADAIATAKKITSEAFDTDVEWVSDLNSRNVHVFATKIDDAYIELTYKRVFPADVYISFTRGGRTSVTGEGSQNKIFGAVINHVKQWVDKNNPPRIIFSAFKPNTGPFGSQDTTRSGLYSKMVQRFASQNGYDYDVENTGSEDIFILKKTDVEESRVLQSKISPLRALVLEYLTFTSTGIMTIVSDGAKSPEAAEELKKVYWTLSQSGKNLQSVVDNEQKLEANKTAILKNIHDMMSYAISHLKANMIPQEFDSKKKQINSVLVKYNDLTKPESVEENFADGKRPGRKGLAKRSGVNTKASVSSLRKTAKSSSGEKQRMAHWLANMKAGKAKKK